MLRIAAALALVVASLAQPVTPVRPPVLGIAHIRLLTSDLRKARTFYGTLLGFPEVAQSNPNTAIFRVNDRQRIIVRGGLPPDQDERFIDVAFETPDVGAMRAFLATRSIAAAGAADAGEGEGQAIECPDPDGHRVRL